MTLCPYQDHFEKADAAHLKATEETHRAYAIWSDSCARLERIAQERLDAWRDLVSKRNNGEVADK